MHPRDCSLFLALCLPFGLACDAGDDDGTREWRVAFEVEIDGAPFRCGQAYDNVGTSNSTIEPRDIRFYAHDVHLVAEDGEQIPLELTDGAWQRDGVALLDFADDTGLCATGNAAMNLEVVGQGPKRDDIVGVQFKLGIPTELNHIDAVRSPAPFNAPGMWWSWTGGFKYARIDVATSTLPTWFIHLGATSCEGSPAQGVECAWDNQPLFVIGNMDPDTQGVVLDMGMLYENSDLEAPIDYQIDFVNGCMAFSGDPECGPIFEKLGATFEGQGQLQQAVFRAK